MRGTTNGSDTGNSFAAHFLATCARIDAEEQAWCQRLRDEGIAAAHPDDGWVDRQKNTVRFAYPHFHARPIEAGAKVALGWPDKYRIVEITKVETGILDSKIYHFEER